MAGKVVVKVVEVTAVGVVTVVGVMGSVIGGHGVVDTASGGTQPL